MVNGQLVDYIKKQSSLGVPQEQIIDYLLSVGWREKEINEALWEANSNVPVPTHLLKKERPGVFWLVFRSLLMVVFVFWIIWEGFNIYDYKSKPQAKVSNYYSVSLKVYKSAVDFWHFQNNTTCPIDKDFSDDSYPDCVCSVDFTKEQVFNFKGTKKTTPIAGQYKCVDISTSEKVGTSTTKTTTSK